jgi:hypothetical protein
VGGSISDSEAFGDYFVVSRRQKGNLNSEDIEDAEKLNCRWRRNKRHGPVQISRQGPCRHPMHDKMASDEEMKLAKETAEKNKLADKKAISQARQVGKGHKGVPWQDDNGRGKSSGSDKEKHKKYC